MPETMETGQGKLKLAVLRNVIADADIGGHVIFPFSQQPLLRFERILQF